MKKNLISVIILALVFANFVLTALLIFTVLPQTKKANKLIEDVCYAIDLDLQSGAATSTTNVPVDQREVWKLNSGTDMTISLKRDSDGKSHYAVVNISFTMNNKSDGYKTFGPTKLTEHDDMIKGEINSIISSYTLAEFTDKRDSDVSAEILKYMQDTYGADFIIGVNFSKAVVE